jgi:hypothetical protein
VYVNVRAVRFELLTDSWHPVDAVVWVMIVPRAIVQQCCKVDCSAHS